jgi:uncharacterized small protein (DUF1192 family)
MGTIPPQELLDKWTLNQLTVEQAAGHLLQHLVMLRHDLNDERIERGKLRVKVDQALVELAELKARIKLLRADVDRLLAEAGLEPTPPKGQRGRPPKS